MTSLFTTWLRIHCIDRAPASPTSLTLPTIRAHQVGNAYTKHMTRVAPRDMRSSLSRLRYSLVRPRVYAWYTCTSVRATLTSCLLS